MLGLYGLNRFARCLEKYILFANLGPHCFVKWAQDDIVLSEIIRQYNLLSRVVDTRTESSANFIYDMN